MRVDSSPLRDCEMDVYCGMRLDISNYCMQGLQETHTLYLDSPIFGQPVFLAKDYVKSIHFSVFSAYAVIIFSG